VGLALAVPVVAITATPRADGPSLAAGASVSPTSSDKARPDKENAGKKDKDLKVNRGFGGLKADRGPHGAITITAIDGSDLSLATEDGWTRTITVTGATVITKGGQPATAADLKAGDRIRFRQTKNPDGSFAITAIVVPTPAAAGEVTAVSAASITIKGRGGAAQVIVVDDSTVYELGNTPGSKADVTVGSKIRALGTNSGDTFTAITVRILLPDVAGEVAAKTDDSITIKRRNGSTTVVHVTDKTTFEVAGDDAATLADIAVGARIAAEGTLRADGSMDAVSVGSRPAKGPNGPKSSGAPGNADPD
jgi:hypothetical protein